MKLAALRTGESGATALHVQTSEGFASVDDLARAAGLEHLRGIADVGELCARGAGAVNDVRGLSRDAATTVLALDAVFAPPVGRPSKIICVGRNYLDHITESGGTRPANIVLFSKFPVASSATTRPCDCRPSPSSSTTRGN